MSNLKYHSRTCLERVRETTKFLGQFTWSTCCDSNLGTLRDKPNCDYQAAKLVTCCMDIISTVSLFIDQNLEYIFFLIWSLHTFPYTVNYMLPYECILFLLTQHSSVSLSVFSVSTHPFRNLSHMTLLYTLPIGLVEPSRTKLHIK